MNLTESTLICLEELYEHFRYCKTKGDIETVLNDESFEDVELTEEEMTYAVQMALSIQDREIFWLDIAAEAVRLVLEKRPKPEPSKDLLNDTLKLIGLKTNEVFFINDQEFSNQALRIDSFGDVFWVGDSNAHPREWPIFGEEHDYLTLGRILTQYPDKIVPLT